MTYVSYTQQSFTSNKRESLQSRDNIRALEISFDKHEVYALEKLIAKIIYDSDEFVTQCWLVIINDVEIHRSNTWAKCYNYITWHYKQETLPMQQQEVETGTPESARVKIPVFIVDSQKRELLDFNHCLRTRILEENHQIYCGFSTIISTKCSRRHRFKLKYRVNKLNCRNDAAITTDNKGGIEMVAEIKLGLCNPPEPIYLYVKNAELSGESYLWYNYDINNEKTIPVQQRALSGYLQNLRLTSKEFKGKDNMKLDIVVAADELYVIRTGIETNFAKTFLLAVSQVQDFSRPLILAATPGEENVVFCRLYDAATKIRIRCEWNKDADWAGIISYVQSKLAGSSVEVPLPQQEQTQVHQAVVPASSKPNQDLRVKQIRTLLNYPVKSVVEWLGFQEVERPSELQDSQVDELVKSMCLSWGQDKFEHPNHVVSSYHEHVVEAVASGILEVTAIQAWMQNVQQSHQKLLN
jgi:hypothetical protein